jgi:hypothetical protein
MRTEVKKALSEEVKREIWRESLGGGGGGEGGEGEGGRGGRGERGGEGGGGGAGGGTHVRACVRALHAPFDLPPIA